MPSRLSLRGPTSVCWTPAYSLLPAQSCVETNECPCAPDSLVQNFFANANFHYYILYPNSFLDEYQAWWSDRAERRPLGLQWTCLLLMICACSTQYINVDLQHRLELDLGESAQKLTETYHSVGRALHSAIPMGHSHFLSVQQLLHSCYWYKSEARFVECWHVLSAAIREAQELGMCSLWIGARVHEPTPLTSSAPQGIHQESTSGEVSEFEREMHRRVWCVLDTWDW